MPKLFQEYWPVSVKNNWGNISNWLEIESSSISDWETPKTRGPTTCFTFNHTISHNAGTNESTMNPGFPHPKPSLSFWLQGTRNSPLIGHGSTDLLPENADVVIIGAGISGAATAYFLLTGPDPPKSVVIIDSREACYGASGRNGGHCRPDCYRGYPGYKATFGKDQAMKIIQNEMDNLELMVEIIEKEKIDCDWWLGKSMDVAMNPACAQVLSAALKEFEADGGPVNGIVDWISDPEEARKRTRIPSAQCAAIFPAASFWPYKFVAHLLQLCINKHGLNLQTYTTATSVSPSSEGWTIETERGSMQASKVIYASNAFTPTLLPEFRDKITPARGQCAAIIPTKAYSGVRTFKHTFAWWRELDDYNYVIQRPQDGIMILGGGRERIPVEKVIGQTDDSIKLEELTEHLRNACRNDFEDWGTEALGEGLLCDWTGIMGLTQDDVPFVGPLQGKPGAFIIAGHCGHGMARAMTCGRGLAALVRGEPWSETKLPECFQPTLERLSRFV